MNDDYGNFPDVKPHIDFPNSPSGASLRYRENCLLNVTPELLYPLKGFHKTPVECSPIRDIRLCVESMD